MSAAGMRAPGKPGVFVMSAEVAALLGKRAGAEISAVDLLPAVSAIVEQMEPYTITHDIE